MKTRAILAALVAAAVGFTAAFAADEEKKDKLAGVKCPVSKQKVKEASSVDYKGGKVYFCCDMCPKAFAKDTAKFATKANQQLVATEQAKQVKCPITGRDTKDGTEVEVGGVEVAFCCMNCQGKVNKAKGDDQLNLVFSDTAFGKGYEVKKAEKK